MARIGDFFAESDAIRPWRKQLLQRTLIVGAIAGVVALVPSVLAALSEGSYLIAVSDVAAYLVWVAILVFRRAPYTARAVVVVATVLYLGVMLMFTLGLMGASFIWLAAPVFIAVLLLPGAYVIATACILVASIAICTWLLIADALAWTLPLAAWFATIGNYLAVTSFISAAIVYLLSGISRSLREERALSRERGVLIGEIHHRVKNNLQTMVSLLRLQGAEVADAETARALARAEVRVMAMAAAHEQMHGREPAEAVDARVLAERITGEAVRLMNVEVNTEVHGESFRVPMEHAVTLSLLVSELVVGTLVASAAVPETLAVELQREANVARIRVSSGPADGADPKLPGRHIVDALVATLGATLDSRVVRGRARHTVELALSALE